MFTSQPDSSNTDDRAVLLQIIADQGRQIEILLEAIRDARRKRFGKSSDKVSADQLGMFDEPEELDETQDDDDETETVTYERKKSKPKRAKLPEHLERVDRLITLAESERVCPHDGELMVEIGEEVSEKLDVIPMQVKVIRLIRKKYGCPCCQIGVKTAPLPDQMIPKGNASEGMLAALAVSKYVDHLPLYRIEAILARMKVDLSRGVMANWMVKVGEQIQPLINLLTDKLIASKFLQMDETRVQVLKEEGKRAESLSYMWVRASLDPMNPVVLFDYDPTRSSEVPKKLLDGFEGKLQTDAYAGYNAVCIEKDLLRFGCWAHVRRKFVDASKSSKKVALANHAVKLIKKLYKVEDEIEGKSAEEKSKIRKEKSEPILTELRAWLDEVRPKVPPQSLLGKALAYADNEWQNLIRYVDHGEVYIDNNFVENLIRPFALGRKNWLFSATVEGANASANIYSLIMTAKVTGLEPYRYLRYVFERLPSAKTLEDFEKLLPSSVQRLFIEQDLGPPNQPLH